MVVTLLLAGFVVYLVEPARVAEVLASANLGLLAAALAVAVADRFLMVWKWFPLLRLQAASATLTAATRAYLASGVAHYVLPASVGADVLRAVVLGREQRAVVEIGASIVAERVLGLVGSGIMAAFALIIAPRPGVDLQLIIPWAMLAVGLGLLALVLPMSTLALRALERLTRALPGGRWLGYLDRMVAAYSMYRRRAGVLAVAAALTLFEQLLPVTWFWLTAQALGVPVAFDATLVVVTLAMFASRLPISVGGLGVGEGALVYLFGLYGVPPSDALAVALAARILEVIVNAGPGLVLWRDLVGARRMIPQGR